MVGAALGLVFTTVLNFNVYYKFGSVFVPIAMTYAYNKRMGSSYVRTINFLDFVIENRRADCFIEQNQEKVQKIKGDF